MQLYQKAHNLCLSFSDNIRVYQTVSQFKHKGCPYTLEEIYSRYVHEKRDSFVLCKQSIKRGHVNALKVESKYETIPVSIVLVIWGYTIPSRCCT